MKFANLTSLFKRYQERWVAFDSEDKIIASDSKLDRLYKKAEKKGHRNPFVSKIPDPKFDYLL